MVKASINKHANYNTTTLHRSRPVGKGTVRRRQVGEQMAGNMHTMGTSFAEKVRDVQRMVDAQNGEGRPDIVEFQH